MYKYEIIRFYAPWKNKGSRRTGVKYKTLEDAQAHCNRPDTQKPNEWFDGYTTL